MTATVLLILAGAFAGGFVSGLAGFGTGLVALGIWLHAVDPQTAAALAIACSVVSQLQTIRLIWHAIERTRVLPFILPGLLGVPLGTRLLAHASPGSFRLGIGFLLVGYSAFMLLGRFRPKVSWGGRPADAVVGLLGGVLGGLAGLSGALPTIWATLRGWGKEERRSVFQAFNLSMLGAALLMHAAFGLLTVEFVKLFAVALPGTLAGAWLGARAYGRLTDAHFHELVLWLLALSGVALVWAAR